MKEFEREHFIDSIVYLIEQTATYCFTEGSKFFDEMDLGVSLDQYITIDTISLKPGICQSELAKLILKDRSFTSRTLNSLEIKGLIERKIEMKGKRLVKRLYLTLKGKQVLADNQERLKKTFIDIFKDISDEEFKTVREILEKMKYSISKYTLIPL